MKEYKATTGELEKKLARVMERLGVEPGKYQYDWNQSKDRSGCYVEMIYCGRAYRFENDTSKSAKTGRRLTYVSDLFAEVVYSLEDLSRAVERGIFTLDMLLAGVPSLPERAAVPPCFAALGFSFVPQSVEEVTDAYHRLARTAHPDGGGSGEAFQALHDSFKECLRIMGV